MHNYLMIHISSCLVVPFRCAVYFVSSYILTQVSWPASWCLVLLALSPGTSSRCPPVTSSWFSPAGFKSSFATIVRNCVRSDQAQCVLTTQWLLCEVLWALSLLYELIYSWIRFHYMVFDIYNPISTTLLDRRHVLYMVQKVPGILVGLRPLSNLYYFSEVQTFRWGVLKWEFNAVQHIPTDGEKGISCLDKALLSDGKKCNVMKLFFASDHQNPDPAIWSPQTMRAVYVQMWQLPTKTRQILRN